MRRVKEVLESDQGLVLMEVSANHRRHHKQRQAYSLPKDIIYDEILLRVPADQITGFKTVCKSWLSLFSLPTFQNSHFFRWKSSQKHPNNNTIILTTFSKFNSESKATCPFSFLYGSNFILKNQSLGYYDPDITIFSVDLHQMRVQNLRFSYPPLTALKLTIRASCHGLLLLSDQLHRLFVYNPLNATYKHLPDRDHDGGDRCSRIYDWTLFYDPTDAKYMVCGFRYHTMVHCHIILLVVGEHLWTEIPYPYYLKPLSPLIFLGSQLHWLTFDTREPFELSLLQGPDYQHTTQCFIVSMDVDASQIKFTTTDVPIKQRRPRRHLLSLVRGCLCLTSFSRDRLKIFVLEDTTRGLWTKRYVTRLRFLSNLPTSLRSLLSDDVCVAVTGELDRCDDLSELVKIFVHHEDQLICYDLKHQESSIIGPLSNDQCLRRSYQFYSPTFVRV